MEIDAGPLDELPPGTVKLIRHGQLEIGVYNCAGKLYALEDRCSHDDGPLCEGDFECDEGVAICPRHGANIDNAPSSAISCCKEIPLFTRAVA